MCVLYGMVNISIYKDSLFVYRNIMIDGYIYIFGLLIIFWLFFDEKYIEEFDVFKYY